MFVKKRRQSGQAIVLVALMMIVLFGFLGLAIDGGREYVQRREVQNSVDAAALAAGDNYLNYVDETKAEQAAANEFATDMRIGSGGAGAVISGLGSDSATATWPDYSGSLAMVVSHNAFNGTDFQMQATSTLPLAFMTVLGQGPNVTIGALAQSVVMGQTQTPALLTLSQAGCPGQTGMSLTIQGNANVALVGALYSNGAIQANSGATNIDVAGNAFTQCGSIPGTINIVCYNPQTNPPSADGPPPCPHTYDVLGRYYVLAPPLPDPNYVAPALPTTSEPSLGSQVELAPGQYPSTLMPASSGCYFLDPGVYYWQSGFTANGGLYSNELRPPDEPVWNNPTNRANPNFWYGTGTNVQHCDGGFSVASVTSSSHPLTPGGSQWGVVVTSVRPSDNGYWRESAPSMCKTVQTDGTSRGFQVAVSNVPGAQRYDIYANPAGCNQATFGYVGCIGSTCGVPATTVNSSAETNTATGTCPYTPAWPGGNAPAVPTSTTAFGSCSLGYEISGVIDSLAIGSNFSVSTSFCPTTGSPTVGCAYPALLPAPTSPGTNDGGLQQPTAGGLPGQTPIMDLPSNGGGDRANEYQCRDQSPYATAGNPCEGTQMTPGAVQFYFPGGSCLNVQGSTGSNFGDLYIFGGRQYKGIVLYSPASNTCTMKLAGGSSTTVIGTVYMPGANLSVKGNSNTAISGQVIVGTAAIDGTSGTAITYNPALSPPPPGARLIR